MDSDSINQFADLWRNYSQSQTSATEALIEQIMRDPRVEANPLQASKVQEAALRWQHALMEGGRLASGRKISLFREEANRFAISDGRPLLAIVYQRHPRGLIPDPIFAPTGCIPANLIRFGIRYWKEFSEAERERTVYALAGWIRATSRADLLKNNRGESLVDEIPAQTAESLASHAPPSYIAHIVSSDIEKKRFCGLVAGHQLPQMKIWCQQFARQTARKLILNFNDENKESKKNRATNETDYADLIGAEGSIDIGDLPPFGAPGVEFMARSDAHAAAREELEDIFPKLTIREREIAYLWASEFTQQQIADFVGVSFETVNTHIDSIRARASGKKPPSRDYQQAQKKLQPKRPRGRPRKNS